MKRKYISSIGIALFTLGCLSCEENKMEVYSDAPALYFDHSLDQADSINYSFFILDESVKRDTVWVTVNTMGALSDADRPFVLRQTNVGQPDAAVAGVHYISFDDTSVKDYFVIPAGQAFQKIPVIFLRDKSLAMGSYRLELTIEPNENFKPGVDQWRNFILTTTDEAVKPKLWDTFWRYTFGSTWGSVKMRFIIQHTGLTDFDTRPSDYSYTSWLGGTVKQALLEYNTAHPDAPLSEADGTLVTFD